jgi:hypothetical protein
MRRRELLRLVGTAVVVWSGVARVRRPAPPAPPATRPTKFGVAVNLNAARALALPVAPAFFAPADEVNE